MITLEEGVAIAILVLVFAGGGTLWFVFVRSQDAAERRRQAEQAERRRREGEIDSPAEQSSRGADAAPEKEGPR